MRRLLLATAALIVSVTGAVAQVGLQDAWRSWQFAAPVAVPEGTSGLASVTIPDAVTRTAATEWRDLRVIDREGRETPYLLHARTGASNAEWRTARTLEPSVVEDQYSQVVVDSGAQSPVHNSARVDVVTADDFVTWVEVAVSDDARAWRVVRERAPMYRLTSSAAGVNTTVDYPDSVSRYVRLRLLDGTRRYEIRGVDLAARVEQPAELVATDIALQRSEVEQRSTWRSTADTTQLPIAGVRFESEDASFLRVVVLESSDDGERWQRRGGGEIYRTTEGGRPRAQLSVRIPEAAATHWRVAVLNRSDTPLAGLRPVLEILRRRVVFRVAQGESYRLLYGNPRATRPEYDLPRLIDARDVEAAAVASVGAAARNTRYVDSAPWTERHPFVLWIAVGLAVATLAVLAVRTLRST